MLEEKDKILTLLRKVEQVNRSAEKQVNIVGKWHLDVSKDIPPWDWNPQDYNDRLYIMWRLCCNARACKTSSRHEETFEQIFARYDHTQKEADFFDRYMSFMWNNPPMSY